jgi:chromosome segregation ATPase
MATERTTDIVLRAQVDKALLPLDQVLQRVKQLTTVLDQQREAAKTGDTTLGEYAKALRDVENAAKDLLRARVALNTYQDKQETLAAKQAAVATARQARDTFQSTLTGDVTKAQERQLGSLDKALQRSEAQANTASRAFEKAAAEMERMQVDINKLAATHAEITIFRDMASDALRAGTAVNDTLIATLKAAKAEKEANAQRIADREKLDAAIAKTNAGLRAEAEAVAKAAAQEAENKQRILSRVSAGLGDLGAKQQAADAAEAAKLREAADRKRAADEQAAEARAKALAQANAGFERLSQQEREKALAAQAAAQAAHRRRIRTLLHHAPARRRGSARRPVRCR